MTEQKIFVSLKSSTPLDYFQKNNLISAVADAVTNFFDHEKLTIHYFSEPSLAMTVYMYEIFLLCSDEEKLDLQSQLQETYERQSLQEAKERDSFRKFFRDCSVFQQPGFFIFRSIQSTVMFLLTQCDLQLLKTLILET